jgi:starvation-inducible DNA-binding protein
MKTDIGLKDNARKAAAAALGKVLGSTYVLYLKTQGFHWNVTGPQFIQLHEMFGAQYAQLAAAVDELAERIRALGEPAPGSYAQFKKLSVIDEQTEVLPPQKMLAELVADHEALVRLARETQETVEDLGDTETGDIMVGRMKEHGKTAWMLRAHLT